MKKNLRNAGLLIGIAILASACNPNAKSFFPLKEGEALSLIQTQVTMDGKPEGHFGTTCFIELTDAQKKPAPASKDVKTLYYLVKTPAGQVNISKLACLGYKVFYNKLRTYELEGLSYEAHAGTINYVGTLQADWTTSRFNAGDLIGVGGFEFGGNQGLLQMRVLTNPEEATKYLETQQLPVEGLPFRIAPLRKTTNSTAQH